MQVNVADAGTLSKRVTVNYTVAEIDVRKSDLIKRFAGQAKIEGFRPGKAPKAMLEKRYGAAAQAQAEEALADEGVNSALREHKLRPFGAIATDSIERKDGLQITVSFETYPTIAFPDAKTFKLDVGDVSVADSEVEEVATAMARRMGDMGPIGDSDTIIADDALMLNGSVTVAGVEIRKLEDFHHLVGGYPLFGKLPADVVAALAGKKVGDSVAFTSTLPANFTPVEHASKEANVTFTVKSGNRLRAAPLDDAMAQKVGAKDLAGLKEMLKLRLISRKQGEARGKQVEQLSAQLLEKISAELPPKAFAAALTQAETEAEAKATEKKEDVAKAKADAKANIEKVFKRHVIMTALGDHLNIEITNDDIRDQILMAAQQTGRKAQDIAKQLQKSGQGNQVAMEIREAKAIETLLDQVLAGAGQAAKA
ncbi:MAG: trigger factor [Planctomycetota bacterium]